MRSASREGPKPPTKPCHDRALDFIARRPHFTAELRSKLLKRGYGQEEVAATLETLQGKGWVDDGETARSFVRQRLARGPTGRRRLQAELGRRGVSSEIAAAVLDELMPEDEAPAAQEAARAWMRRRRGRWDRAALARHLQGKGFAPRAIVAALELLRRAVESASSENVEEDDLALWEDDLP
ncbi:MAG: regulatory protein RecX [Acidobacteriota bacterium]